MPWPSAPTPSPTVRSTPSSRRKSSTAGWSKCTAGTRRQAQVVRALQPARQVAAPAQRPQQVDVARLDELRHGRVAARALGPRYTYRRARSSQGGAYGAQRSGRRTTRRIRSSSSSECRPCHASGRRRRRTRTAAAAAAPPRPAAAAAAPAAAPAGRTRGPGTDRPRRRAGRRHMPKRGGSAAPSSAHAPVARFSSATVAGSSSLPWYSASRIFFSLFFRAASRFSRAAAPTPARASRLAARHPARPRAPRRAPPRPQRPPCRRSTTTSMPTACYESRSFMEIQDRPRRGFCSRTTKDTMLAVFRQACPLPRTRGGQLRHQGPGTRNMPPTGISPASTVGTVGT